MKSSASSAAGRVAIYGTLIVSFFSQPFVTAQAPAPVLSLNNETIFGDIDYYSVARRAEGQWLRIMPLGASITAGSNMPEGDPGNGYRKALRDNLRANLWNVNMVGQQRSGNMSDNDHEGYPGKRVAEIHSLSETGISRYKPNVILINAGTNDATQNRDDEPAKTAHLRLELMLTDIWAVLPNTVIILSTLIPNNLDPANVDLINVNYRNLYQNLKRDGKPIVLAEMNDGKFITSSKLDIHDDTHPTPYAQRKMAAVWAYAINTAEREGLIKTPVDNGTPDAASSTTCEKVFGSGNTSGRSGVQILHAANPLISDDGPYQHGSRKRGLEGNWTHPSDAKFHFANLAKIDPNAENYQALDDLVSVATWFPGEPNETRLMISWQNIATKLSFISSFNIPDGCDPSRVRFGDVDGDGLDDFICIRANSEMFVARNTGKVPLEFESKGVVKSATNGYTDRHVRLGDIDGDGRIDYCLIGEDGNVRCWRNGGIGEVPAYWQDFGEGQPIFMSQGLGDIRGMRFVDINGDGRADWIWLDEKGGSTIFINQRAEGKGMTPRWTRSASSHGGGFELDDGGTRDHILFGRVFQSGRADYIRVVVDEYLTDGLCRLHMDAYENLGSGGRFQKGDGAYWGDMRNAKVDDYVWISPDGVINVFPNLGKTLINSGDWDPSAPVWAAAIRALETGMDRRALHIGDWNGDGYADIIGVERRTGKLTIWLTKWEDGRFSFTQQKIDRDDLCKENWGQGYFDNAHHFADITGNGRVDYLCMEPSGRVTGWINYDSGLVSVGQVKFGENLDRANYRFADVNGDGRADMIWTDKFNGDAKVWQNLGMLPGDDRVSGSKFRWDPKGVLYQGSSKGPNLHFPNLGGLGRADMVQIDPSTAHGFIWYNTCPGAMDDTWMDPKLPDYNPANGEGSIQSYIHFGDSYGAGMGTGTTSTGKCRVGSNNFGRLLHAWMNDPNIEYVERVCAGDTLTGLTKQISNWTNPAGTKMATLSIGGNDVGFADLAYSCILTPNPYKLKEWFRKNCLDYEQKARDYMLDMSPSGLRSKLKEAYLSILRKSGQDHFHLYVTGYVNFFNAVSDDCAGTTFYYWEPAYWNYPILSRNVFLSKDLRVEINELVDQLNYVIASAVEDANASHGSAKVHFAETAPSFSNGHRWCENPNAEFHEPYAARQDTWLFLSGWKDVAIEGAADVSDAVEAAEKAEMISNGQIPLPNSETCRESLGTDPDPYDHFLCLMSIDISMDPEGPTALNFQAAQAAVARGDFNSQDIDWYLPTRTIKTFHPRSPGMVAYRDAVIAAMRGAGQA
ncbi:hypothetical protein VE03_09357 [Pseudogymnoascus sp. 23342-1-I1]|nr:hypothetical protein VE03_09357 [Pseudogymnoascus sp. 23342-1-I1]